MNDSSKEIATKYKLLFRLPSYKVILVETVLLSILFGVIHGLGRNYFVKKSLLKNIVSFSFGYYMIPAFLSTYMTKRIIKGEVLTERRLAGLSLFTVLFMGISNITGITVSVLMNSMLIQEIITIISCGIITSLKYLVICTLEEQRLKAFLSSISHYIMCIIVGALIYQLIEKYGIFNMILRSIYVAGSFTITSWFLMDTVDKIGLKITKIKGTKLFNAFATYWLAHKKEKIEKILEKQAYKEDVKIKSIIFFDEKEHPTHVIIIPEFHFGPFRDLGSSQFPHLMINRLEEIGIKGIVLHGVSEHGQDIAKNSHCKYIIDKIIEEIHKVQPTESQATPILKIRKGKCTIYCQLFHNIALLIITRAPYLTEDLPIWIREKIRKIAKRIGIKDVIVVDAHNSIRDDEQISEKDYKEIIKGVEKALIEAKKRKLNKLKIGMKREKIKEYDERQGIGKGGVIGLTLNVENKKYTFIIFDGNNMMPKFREKVIQTLSQKKVQNVEVLTTDTHSVNGLTSKERGYHPVGEIDPERVLVDYALRVAKESERKITTVTYTIKEITVKNVKVLGEDMLTKFSKAINESLRAVKKISVTLFTLSTVTSIILFLL